MPKRNPVRSEGKMIHVRLSEEMRRKLRVRVATEDTTIQNWVVHVIEQALESSTNEHRTGKKDSK